MTNSMIPYSFSPGTKARADEVNANFIALADKIDENKSAQSNDVKEINSALSKKADKTELINEYTVTASDTDLNDYKIKGTYVFTATTVPKNTPNGQPGLLIVTGMADSVIKQIWFCDGLNTPLFTRNYSSGSWSTWSPVLGFCNYTNPGSLRLANGLIIQWGSMVGDTVVYPIAFSTIAAPVFTKQGWAADRARSDTGFNYQSLTGFNVGSMGVFSHMNWIAIGF